MRTLGDITELKTLKFRDAAGKVLTWTITNQAADRTITIPALSTNDTLVFNNNAATLQNKTIPTNANNVVLGITDTIAGYLVTITEDVGAWMFNTDTRISSIEAIISGSTPDSSTTVMSSTPLTDNSSVPWVIVIKTLTGAGTYTLASPAVANKTYHLTNKGTGTLTINGNGVNIDSAATYNLDGGASTWIRFNGTTWSTIGTVEASAVAAVTALSTSTTLTANTVYSVDASGDLTFVVPTGTSSGDTIQVKRNGFGGANVFTGTFRNSETAIIVRDWNYSLKLTWSASRSLWIYE